MTTDQDFDGCNSECRRKGAHTLRWGGCEHAPEPEPTVSMSVVYTDHDGQPSIGFDRYTVQQLADLIEPALRTVAVRLGPNALGMLERGETVGLSGGEYADLARTAAHAIVHRHDEQPAAVSAPVQPSRADVLREAAGIAESTISLFPDTMEGDAAAGAMEGLADRFRRMADEEQPAEAVRPPQHSWRVETLDPLPNEWAPGSHFLNRQAAVERYETANRTAPLWKDGTPVQRRIVRETTTYTVEPAPPA